MSASLPKLSPPAKRFANSSAHAEVGMPYCAAQQSSRKLGWPAQGAYLYPIPYTLCGISHTSQVFVGKVLEKC
jgi:hypothetical protein